MAVENDEAPRDLREKNSIWDVVKPVSTATTIGVGTVAVGAGALAVAGAGSAVGGAVVMAGGAVAIADTAVRLYNRVKEAFSEYEDREANLNDTIREKMQAERENPVQKELDLARDRLHKVSVDLNSAKQRNAELEQENSSLRQALDQVKPQPGHDVEQTQEVVAKKSFDSGPTV